MTQLVTPNLCRLPTIALARTGLASLANNMPVFFIKAAMCDVLPPGAALMSRIFSPSCGASAMTGRKLEAPCEKTEKFNHNVEKCNVQ